MTGMRVGILAVQHPFRQGAAEEIGEGLLRALRAEGHAAEIVPIPFAPSARSRVADHLLACRLLDLEESCGARIDRVIGLTFPATLVPHSRKTLWLLDGSEDALGAIPGEASPTADAAPSTQDLGAEAAPGAAAVLAMAREAEARLLPEAQAVFAATPALAARARTASGTAAPVLRAPPADPARYARQGEEEYILVPVPSGGAPGLEMAPGLSLAADALGRTRRPVRLHLVGAGAAEAGRAFPAGVADRIAWDEGGEADDAARFGTCLAVLRPGAGDGPDPDAAKAMLAEKPVIACAPDACRPDLVRDGATGLVRPPDADALAAAMDALWDDRALARHMGRAGRALYAELGITWAAVMRGLLG